MAMFRDLTQMLQADIRSLVSGSTDRLGAARALVRELEEEASRQRGRLCGLENREAAARRARDRVQEDEQIWQRRAEEAAGATDARTQKRTVGKSAELARQLQAAEEKWWEATRAAEEVRKTLATLENQAQAARRQKDSLLTVERRERPSSEFVALPESSHSVLCQPPRSEEIEQEMELLKKELGKRDPGR